jgi:hypothetical protein
MVRAIVDHVAALAEALEIAQPIIAWVVIKVRCSQDDPRFPHLRCFLEIGPLARPAAATTPSVASGIEPTSIGQTANDHAMRPTASLANAGGALEPHAPTNQ